ncbi:hypothetical protein SAMN05661091_4106 [Paenibacillus uliginis N3/975]|uniref:Uncharacterized protein n=1 Tax=Paenibacillus uliginis N3/975 TaxID=1313296 RepID=A0A1X7HL64_9BACL|nr:hypothetical protein [Paenibacillus uliginis]SMF88086.1 hypothetical protein SAMN05661091_4106 [Paenibacillus uliginis N3/975]
MNAANELRKKMVQALQAERRMLAERRYLEALDARGEYRRCRQELLKLWGDRRDVMQEVI